MLSAAVINYMPDRATNRDRDTATRPQASRTAIAAIYPCSCVIDDDPRRSLFTSLDRILTGDRCDRLQPPNRRGLAPSLKPPQKRTKRDRLRIPTQNLSNIPIRNIRPIGLGINRQQHDLRFQAANNKSNDTPQSSPSEYRDCEPKPHKPPPPHQKCDRPTPPPYSTAESPARYPCGYCDIASSTSELDAQTYPIIQPESAALAEELKAFLSDRFFIAVWVRVVRGGMGYRLDWVQKGENRHLMDIRQVEVLPESQEIEGIRVMAVVELVASKVVAYFRLFPPVNPCT